MKILNIKPYDNFDVTFRLAICKTRKEMLREIKKYREKLSETGYTDSNTMGMFCPTPHYLNNELPGCFTSNVFGTMFLNLADINDEIIIHECGHAAFAWEEHIRKYTGSLYNDGMDEQEEFCYFLGAAADKVMKAVKEYRKHG